MPTDLENILANIFERTRHQRRNPATKPVQSLGLNSELPIGIVSANANFLAEPIYGFYRTEAIMIDHFENDGDADEDLDQHTADSGETWTAQSNQLDLKTEDYVHENGGGLALYTVSGRLTSNMIVSCVYQEHDLSTGFAGLIFRFQDSSNYWRAYRHNATQFRLEEIAGGTPQANLTVVPSVAPADGDSITVVALGSSLLLFINGKLQGTLISTNQNDESDCGLFISNGNTAKFSEFRASDIATQVFDFEETVRGHTFFGGPEEYTYLLEGSLTEKELDLVVLDRFRPPASVDEDISNHLADTGHVWTERQGGFTVLTSGVCVWDGGTQGIATVDAGTPDVRISLNNLRRADRTGIVIRWVDNTHYWRVALEPSGPNIRLQKVDTGTTDIITTTIAPSGEHNLMIEAIGSTWRLWVDGVLAGTAVDNFQETIEDHGIFGLGSGRLLDFKIWDIVS